MTKAAYVKWWLKTAGLPPSAIQRYSLKVLRCQCGDDSCPGWCIRAAKGKVIPIPGTRGNRRVIVMGPSPFEATRPWNLPRQVRAFITRWIVCRHRAQESDESDRLMIIQDRPKLAASLIVVGTVVAGLILGGLLRLLFSL